MHRPTLQIFRHLLQDVSEYAPPSLIGEMRDAEKTLHENGQITIDDLEQIIIHFGKKTWPYRKAFNSFLVVTEGQMGEQFFVQKLSLNTKKAYTAYIGWGGTLQELMRGRQLTDFFLAEDRLDIARAVIELRGDIRRYVTQQVQSVLQKQFEAHVTSWTLVLQRVEEDLAVLREMAEESADHPHVASEIRAHIRACEYGLCLLGPETHHETLGRGREHFEGRKMEMALRFINGS